MDSRPPWIEIAITLAGIVLLAGLVFAVPALHDAAVAAIHGDTGEVRRQINSLGVAGPLLIVALTLVHAVVFYPAEIINAAAGLVYGFLPALALMTCAWVFSGLLCFAVGRSVARPLARGQALRARRGSYRAGRRKGADRRPTDPDPALQPGLLRGGGRLRAGLAVYLDDGGRLPADHRRLGLLRHQAGRAQRALLTVKRKTAGERSTLPAASRALTETTCLPMRKRLTRRGLQKR